MIKLQEQFKSGAGGFSGPEILTYNQVIRSDTAAVYERSRDGKVKDFEVFKIKFYPKGMIQKFPNGTTTTIEDDTERYPSNGDFGKIAWCCGKTEAMRRFNEISNSAVKLDDEDDEIKIIEIDETVPVVSTGRRGRAPKQRHDLVIPDGEFTTNDLTELNQVDRNDAVFYINQELGKKIQFIGEKRIGENKRPSKIYKKI